MKNLLFLFIVGCMTTMVSAQEMALSITGFENSDTSTRMLIQQATVENSKAYKIVKVKDRHSATLSSAAQGKQVFATAYLLRKFENGDIITTRLVNVWFSDVSETAQGASASETFTVHFEREEQLY